MVWKRIYKEIIKNIMLTAVKRNEEVNMFTIDVMSWEPVYEQLIKQVEDNVLIGIM